MEKETISKGNGSNGRSAVPYTLDQIYLDNHKTAKVRAPVGSQAGVARNGRLESIVKGLLTELGVDVHQCEKGYNGPTSRPTRLGAIER